MIDYFKLKSGVNVSVFTQTDSSGIRKTNIFWKPKPPFTEEQTKEIDGVAMPRILDIVSRAYGIKK